MAGASDGPESHVRNEMAPDVDAPFVGPKGGAPESGKEQEFFGVSDYCIMTNTTITEHRKKGTADARGNEVNEGGEVCPACGAAAGSVFLKAPDRLHGRKHVYTLVRCDECTLVWLKDAPRPEEMHEHYTEAYNRLISAGGKFSPQRWRDRKATLTQYKQSGTLLDLGCSSGSWLEFIKADGWKLYGVEMSPQEAQTAEVRTGATIFNGTVIEADFTSETFDVITCFDVLEHLYQPREIMQRVARWLKPGGIFYVLVPNIESAEGRVFGSYWHGLELPRHLFHYSPKSLSLLAQAAGLQTRSVETHRNPAIGISFRYFWHDALSTLGVKKTPVAYRNEASLPWRAARKIVRMSILRGLLAVAPVVGGGESIHGVFQKPKVHL